VGMSVREPYEFHVFKCKTALVAAGGALSCVQAPKTGAWFLLFKSRATSASGTDYMGEGFKEGGELHNGLPYGAVKPIPTCLRNHLMMQEM